MAFVYLDNAATTPISAEVRTAMQPWQGERFGNPSAVHRVGLQSREAVDEARGRVARAVGATPEQVTFTSGGSEANNLAVLGIARKHAATGRHILIGATEHPSVRASAESLRDEGFEVEAARLDASGALDLEQLATQLRADTVLVAQMLVCNQFGSIYPVARVARLVRARSPHAKLHVDAVQAVGKLDVRMQELDADSLSLSAHKLYGPQGVGALVTRRGLELRQILFGGGQESGRRAGTENVAGVVGLGVAAQQAAAGESRARAQLIELRERLGKGLTKAGAQLFEAGRPTQQIQPAILTVIVPGAPAEVWLHHLDARGVCVSTGSACQARSSEISPSLLAAGFDATRARQVLRVSLSTRNTAEEVDLALEAFRKVGEELGHL